MSRLPRNQILFDGCYAHIMSRSFDFKFIFQAPEDFNHFKELLQTAKKEFRFQIHHYCLMNTHFHLAVSISQLHLFAKAFQRLKSQYTKWFNKKEKRTGPLWRERFKSLLIEDESYLYACGLYIEANPVKAGIVEMPEEWPYSSARYYLLNEADPLIDSYDSCQLPNEVDLNNSTFFTKGKVIGSELCKLQVEQNAFVSVP